jgi:ankyrin repeat protein
MINQQTWFQAATEGDLNTLKQVLNDGFDINTQDKKLNTAMHHTIKHGAKLIYKKDM